MDTTSYAQSLASSRTRVTICDGVSSGPEGNFRGALSPVARILTFVPPMSIDNTFMRRASESRQAKSIILRWPPNGQGKNCMDDPPQRYWTPRLPAATLCCPGFMVYAARSTGLAKARRVLHAPPPSLELNDASRREPSSESWSETLSPTQR